MKKIISRLFPLALLISGCCQEELQDNQPEYQDGRIFTAAFDQNETRTYVENGNLLRWNAGDQISLFDGNTLNRQYKFDGETGDNAGTFSIVNAPYGSGNDLSANYAVYPYASDVKITESGVITLTLPAEQSYADNSFGLGSNTMVAVTKDIDDTFLKFKNVGGYLKLQLYGDDVTVKSITLKGNNNEKLAGKANITTTYDEEPTVSMSDEATPSIKLNCTEGVKIGSTKETATAFWVVVPSKTFVKGFTITITDIDGGKMTKSTSNEVSIVRNVIKPMAAFEVETVETIPNNQIWYTSSDGKIVNPYMKNAFGADIESNVYKDGKGIITFGNDITAIERNAFQDCTTLTSITIPDSITSIEISTFNSCSALTDVTVSDNVTMIGDYAFYDCKSLKTISGLRNVKSIGYKAFSSCSSLKNIDISNISSIGDYAFYGCKSLTKVTLSSNMTGIGRDAFAWCSSLRDITIPQGVTSIEKNTFVNCTSLSDITLPDSITSIGEYAFQSCPIAQISIPNVTAIGKLAFSSCRKLRTLTIPDGVTEIGEKAFQSCVSLTDINIPKSLTRIENNTFSSCGIKSIEIHNGVTYIGEGAFISCSELQNIELSSSITTIESDTFRNCTSLQNITIHNGLTSIEGSAFNNTGLTDITIPNSVVNIGDYAFCNCESLTNVNIEAKTPPVIYSNTFLKCNAEVRFYVPAESLKTYKAADYWKDLNIIEAPVPNNQIWYTSSDGNIVTPYKAKGFNVNIDSNVYVDGKGIITFDGEITTIYASAFENCATLVNIKFPDCVNFVGEDAFSGCTSLVAIDIPRISIIKEYTFNGCTALSSVTIPDTVTQIEDSAFWHCKSLKTVTLPNSLITVGGFSGCEFSEITIPESVKTIGPHAFQNCKNLKSISIPDGVRTIGNYAFDTCTGLKTIIIPDNITIIGDHAFYNCSGLTSIIIGSNVRNIGYNAFRRCTGISTLTLPASIETIDNHAFGDMQLTSMTCLGSYPPSKGDPFWSGENNYKIDVLYVPSGAKDNYASNPNWNNYFKTIIEL